LPDRIVLFRDGVGEGQVNFVLDSEVGQVELAIHAKYEKYGLALPKFSFVIVTKKINTRAMLKRGAQNFDNPKSGTVFDNMVTLPERYFAFVNL